MSNHTKGEWSIRPLKIDQKDPDIIYIDGEKRNLCICKLPFASEITKEQQEADARLIADAGNTMNACNMLPSELLEQTQTRGDKLVELTKINMQMLKALRLCKGLMNNYGTDEGKVIVREAIEAGQKQ